MQRPRATTMIFAAVCAGWIGAALTLPSCDGHDETAAQALEPMAPGPRPAESQAESQAERAPRRHAAMPAPSPAGDPVAASGRGRPAPSPLSKVIAQSRELMSRARAGDAASAIALLAAVDQCFPLSAESAAGESAMPLRGCETLPGELVANRIEILEAAMAQDSAEAKLAYARAVSGVYRFDPFARGQDLNGAAEVGRLSEVAAGEAARQGLTDAFRFLASSYLDGSFGVRDVAKAYGYLLALHSIDAAGADPGALIRLRDQLAPSQAAEGVLLARELSARPWGSGVTKSKASRSP